MFLDRAGEEFEVLVRPLAAYLDVVDDADVRMMNMVFSEWLLFERAWDGDLTPLEFSVERGPFALSAAAHHRLLQVCETQFFSRFEILEKRRRAGVAVLRDILTQTRYDVHDRHICEMGHWREGTIALRIAYVDGCWLSVGQVYLYDRAPLSVAGDDGPGAVHPEDARREPSTRDMSFFLRLARDVIGVEGRYSSSARMRTMDGDAG